MEAANRDIRKALKKAGIPLWRLGVLWGCSEVTVIRRLRMELPEKEKAHVFSLIEQLKSDETE